MQLVDKLTSAAPIYPQNIPIQLKAIVRFKISIIARDCKKIFDQTFPSEIDNFQFTLKYKNEKGRSFSLRYELKDKKFLLKK